VKPLDSERQALAAQWVGLAHLIALRHARRRRLQVADCEIARSAALLALCEAARYYQSEKGHFAPYATRVINRAVRRELQCHGLVRVPRRARWNQSVVLGAQAEQVLAAAVAPAADRDRPLDLAFCLARLSDRDHLIIDLRLQGLTLKAIARRLGQSREKIRLDELRVLRRIRRWCH
jgi:RNA polymerase sigma factor (sigma-70 family)